MKKVLKTILAAALILAAATALTACSGNKAPAVTEAPAETEATVATEAPTDKKASAATEGSAAEKDGTTLAEKAAGILPDAGSLMECPAEDFSDVLGIEPEEYTDACWLASTGMDGREILAIRGKAESAGHIAEALDFYLGQRRKETQNYAPDAYRLLKGASVKRSGNTFVLVVGEQAEAESAALLAGE